jgi:hypothetical protein
LFTDFNENIFIVLIFVVYFSYTYITSQTVRDINWRESKKMQFLLAQRYMQVAWIVGIGMLSWNGYFTDFSGSFPHLFYPIILSFAFLLFIARSEAIGELLAHLSPRILIYFQLFRLGLAFILHSLASKGQIAPQMTFTGYNFDILIGLTAPIIGFFAISKTQIKNGRVVLAWNMLGLFLIMAPTIIGLFAAPTRFMLIEAQPNTAMLAQIPWIWLLTYLVPFACMLHILSIRQSLSHLKVSKS